MSQPPEHHEWPVVPTSGSGGTPVPMMRASDADRDDTARVLGEAYAQGRLTLSEHADRLHAAMSARTLGDLGLLTHDLPTVQATAPAPWTFGAPRPDQGNALLVAIFGGARRTGQWFVPAFIRSLTLFGGTELDLREATFTAPMVDVDLICLFGGVQVIVPEGVRVEPQVISLFGGSATAQTNPQPGAPTVRLRGLCLFGGVDVKVKRRRTPPTTDASTLR